MIRICRLSLSILSMFLLVSCGEATTEEAGIFLQIMLKDKKGQEISYLSFNPNVKTLEACNAKAEEDMDDIVKGLPPEYSGSTVTGWLCSFTNPEAGKIKIDRVDS
ncbi:MAG: hypothetical protein O3A65_02490 [Proteobacteria bacterium]|nr:hypothetical protein [Pseudomonadota bacterium]